MRVLWVALDWGTTNLSAYVIGKDNQILQRLQSDKGMSQLDPEKFEPALLDCIGPWLRNDEITPVIAYGMIGAQQGWLEAPYAVAPCLPVTAESVVTVPTKDPRISVQIVPGVCQRAPDDVMRGEETQIAGYLADHHGFGGVFCLPGKHSKWVRVADGQIRNFTTFMTGEMFGLLSNQSILRHCVGGSEWDDAAFVKSVEAAVRDPAGLTAKLFSLRPQALLNGTPSGTLKATLSGFLIGTELAAARQIWDRRDIVIVGDRENARLYKTALATLGKAALTYDSDSAIVQGLRPIAELAHCEFQVA